MAGGGPWACWYCIVDVRDGDGDIPLNDGLRWAGRSAG